MELNQQTIFRTDGHQFKSTDIQPKCTGESLYSGSMIITLGISGSGSDMKSPGKSLKLRKFGPNGFMKFIK